MSVIQLDSEQWKELLQYRVLVLSKINCIYCTKVKELLTSVNMSFFEYDCTYLLENADSKQIFLEQIQLLANKKYTTFPMVFIDGEFIGGYIDVGAYLEKQNAFAGIEDF